MIKQLQTVLEMTSLEYLFSATKLRGNAELVQGIEKNCTRISNF